MWKSSYVGVYQLLNTVIYLVRYQKKSNIFEFLKKVLAVRALIICPLFCLRDIITSKYLDGTGFESLYKQEISLLQNVQAGGAQTAP